jgi:hypothetical protein
MLGGVARVLAFRHRPQSLRCSFVQWISTLRLPRTATSHPLFHSLATSSPSCCFRLNAIRSLTASNRPQTSQENSSNAVVREVVDHAFVKFLQAVLNHFHAAVDLTNRLIAEIEQIRVEKRQMPIRRGSARHVVAGDASHCRRIVLVPETKASLQSSAWKVRHIPSRIDIGVVRASISLTMMLLPTLNPEDFAKSAFGSIPIPATST